MASTFAVVAVLIFISVNLLSSQAKKLIMEEGYSVTTVFDGHKLGINPRSVLPLFGSSNLVILDSAASTFYTASFSNPGVIEKLSGNGVGGYSDGDLGSAMFNKPKSFAVDSKNNIYVADQKMHTIRKISKSGVTTIAGDYMQKLGKADGPAQNASFSIDFELAFIPQICALMISDHGNQLIRQINLKAEDCAKYSESVLGVASAWALGLGVACLFGLIIGFAVRPYILPYDGFNPRSRPYLGTCKRCLTNLGKQVQMFCFDIRSGIASRNVYELLRRLSALSLSHLSLMFGLNLLVNSPTLSEKPVSLLDCDMPCRVTSSETSNSQMLAYQLEDLVSLEGSMNPAVVNEIMDQADEKRVRKDAAFPESRGLIDNLIQANIMDFAEQGTSTYATGSWEKSPGLFDKK